MAVSQTLEFPDSQADHYSAEDSRVTLCRSPELSLLWYFPLQILAALAFLNSQLQLLSAGKLPVPVGEAWLFFLRLLHSPVGLTRACSLTVMAQTHDWKKSKLIGQSNLHG